MTLIRFWPLAIPLVVACSATSPGIDVDAHEPGIDSGADAAVSVELASLAQALVIGALHEDSAATGIDGDETDDSATRSGAVYIFH